MSVVGTQLTSRHQLRWLPGSATLQRLVTLAVLPLGIASLWIGLTNDNLQNSELGAVYRTYLSIAPILIGLFWWVRRPTSRMGPLLVIFGLITWPVTFLASSVPALFAIGVAAQYPFFVMTFLLILAFPAGRLDTKGEIALIGGYAIVDTIALIGVLLFTSPLQGGGPLALCRTVCPPNPFQVGSAPGLVQLLTWSDFWVGVVAVSGTLVIYLMRLAGASRPLRRELAVVGLTSALFVPIVLAYYIGGEIFHIPAEALAVLRVLLTIARVVFPIGFLIALLQADYYALRVDGRLMRELATGSSPERWRDVVAAVVDDPSLRLGFWEPETGHFCEPDGTELSSEPGRAWVPIARKGDPVAAISTDTALSDEPELLAAVTEATLIAVQHGDLEGELQASRARLVKAGDTERRRIQRDLHDSAQQRLVALRIHLTLASERVGRPEERAALQGLGEEIDAALDDLRNVASTAYPPVLARMGVAAALQSVCRRASIPVTVIDRGLQRHAEALENTTFFVCLEAIQNASKHAGPGATVTVDLREDGSVATFAIQDDGMGFDPDRVERGLGLTNMIDRLGSVGGTLSIVSSPGHGTRIMGSLPVEAPVAAR